MQDGSYGDHFEYQIGLILI